MKKYVFLLLLPFTAVLAHSQTPKAVTQEPVVIGMTDRVGVDFEVKDQPAPDPMRLQLVQIDHYEPLRKQSEDVWVEDEPSGFTIILYSLDRVRQNKEANPLFNHE